MWSRLRGFTASAMMHKQSSPKVGGPDGHVRVFTRLARRYAGCQKSTTGFTGSCILFKRTHKQVLTQSEATNGDRRRRLGTADYAESYLHTLFTILGICIKKEIWNSLIEHAGERNNASLKRGIEANGRDGAGGES